MARDAEHFPAQLFRGQNQVDAAGGDRAFRHTIELCRGRLLRHRNATGGLDLLQTLAPSESVPDKTTATARCAYCSASERNRIFTGLCGRSPLSRGLSRKIAVGNGQASCSAESRKNDPASIIVPSAAVSTAIAVLLAKISVRKLGWRGSRCCTSRIGHPGRGRKFRDHFRDCLQGRRPKRRFPRSEKVYRMSALNF